MPQDGAQQSLVKNIQDAATELYELFNLVDKYDPRSGHLARTKLEESVMWSIKGVTGIRE